MGLQRYGVSQRRADCAVGLRSRRVRRLESVSREQVAAPKPSGLFTKFARGTSYGDAKSLTRTRVQYSANGKLQSSFYGTHHHSKRSRLCPSTWSAKKYRRVRLNEWAQTRFGLSRLINQGLRQNGTSSNRSRNSRLSSRSTTSGDTRDGLLSRPRKFPDKLRKLFRRRSTCLQLSRGRRSDRQRAPRVKSDRSSESAAVV